LIVFSEITRRLSRKKETIRLLKCLYGGLAGTVNRICSYFHKSSPTNGKMEIEQIPSQQNKISSLCVDTGSTCTTHSIFLSCFVDIFEGAGHVQATKKIYFTV
jgi:hypothetical protein